MTSVIHCPPDGSQRLHLHSGPLSRRLPLGPHRTLTILEWFAYGEQVAQATIDFRRRDSAGGHQDLRIGSEGAGFEELQAGTLFGEAGKWRASFSWVVGGVSGGWAQMSTDEHRWKTNVFIGVHPCLSVSQNQSSLNCCISARTFSPSVNSPLC